MSADHVVSSIEESGIIAVIRGMDPGCLKRVVDSLLEGGIRVLEITMNSPRPLEVIRETRSLLQSGDLLVGVGTVLDAETARAAIHEGAQFVVSPHLDLEVIRTCRRYSCPVIPGALTPTEIIQAWEAGADLVKVFPARLVGADYLKDLKGPLPQVKVVPTGGITLENAAAFIEAGASALGVGGSLVSRDLVSRGKFEELALRAREFGKAVARGRGE